MASFHLTNKAIDDLTEIWDYTIEQWSESQAEKYYNLLIACFTHVSKNPKIGKSYHIVSPKILGYKCGEHIIFYEEIGKNEIEIIRILHGMMDLKSRI
jgi:toxin ParE1/3/4